jgi:hypothetical protein
LLIGSFGSQLKSTWLVMQPPQQPADDAGARFARLVRTNEMHVISNGRHVI